MSAGTGSDDTVSVCIPTWRSQPFITKTLDHALGQTHRNIRVLVSVDAFDDGTAQLCEDRARTDDRLEVFVQPERLGWAGNVNFLLDRVRTPTYCLYFHDDIIEPGYVATLLAALQARPDATSVHCDMGHFGAGEHVSLGVDYPDSAVQRLAWFFVAPNRGSPLRSLTRSSLLANGLRLPTDAPDGLWANEPYLLNLLAAGPALRVPQVLYHRWDKRSGGLTDGWQKLTLEQHYAGNRANATSFLATVDAATNDPRERAALHHCVQLNVMHRIRALEQQRQIPTPITPADLHPAFAESATPPNLSVLGEQLALWTRRAHNRLAALTTTTAS